MSALFDDRLRQVMRFLEVPRPRSYLAAVLGWSTRQTTEVLAYGRDLGLVESTGGGRHSVWRLCGRQ